MPFVNHACLESCDTSLPSSEIGVDRTYASGSFTISIFSDLLNRDVGTPDSPDPGGTSCDQRADHCASTDRGLACVRAATS